MKKVKSITRYILTEEQPGIPLLRTREVRDPKGNILEEVYYFPDGTIEQKTIRILNAEGQLIEEQEFTESDTPDQVTTYTLGPAGKIQSKTITYRNGAASVTSYQYNESDHSITMTTKDQKGGFEGKIYQRLDAEDRVLEEIRHDEKNIIEQQQQISYNDEGRPVSHQVHLPNLPPRKQFYDYFFNDKGLLNEVEIFDEKEEVLRADSIEYDDHGNRIRYVMEDFAEGQTLEETWEYDDQQRIIKNTKQKGTGLLLESSEFTFGDHGQVTEINISRPTGVQVDRFEYEFFEEE